jgi:hypothetical protein
MFQRFKMWGANAVIVLMLGLMCLQAWPGVPQWLSYWPSYVGDLLCLGQHSWSMFAPDPDSENFRLIADIEYADGHVVHWQSPYLPDQSLLQRFAGHRRSEFADAIRSSDAGLPGFAAWLARTERKDGGTLETKRVQIFLEQQRMPDPRLHGWKMPEGPPTYDRRLELYP